MFARLALDDETSMNPKNLPFGQGKVQVLMLLFLRTKPECITGKINQCSVGGEQFGAEQALQIFGWGAKLTDAPVLQIRHANVDLLPDPGSNLEALQSGYSKLMRADFSDPDDFGIEIILEESSS